MGKLDDFIERNSVIIIISILIISLGLLISMGIYSQIPINKAGEKIGFESVKYKNSFEFCEDYKGNLHYVKIKCSGGWLTKECKVNLISVGDVRVVSGGT